MAMSQLVGQWHARTRLFPESLVSREISADDELLTTGEITYSALGYIPGTSLSHQHSQAQFKCYTTCLDVLDLICIFNYVVFWNNS